MNLTVPTNIYVVYVAQISFYVHSLYATVFVDQWRRDSIVLIGHHIITALLLIFSLATRCVQTHISYAHAHLHTA